MTIGTSKNKVTNIFAIVFDRFSEVSNEMIAPIIRKKPRIIRPVKIEKSAIDIFGVFQNVPPCKFTEFFLIKCKSPRKSEKISKIPSQLSQESHFSRRSQPLQSPFSEKTCFKA